MIVVRYNEEWLFYPSSRWLIFFGLGWRYSFQTMISKTLWEVETLGM